MIIYGPTNVHYDIDVGPVAVSDWYHKEYFDIVQTEVMADGPPPPSDNNLINGKGDLNCIFPSNCTTVLTIVILSTLLTSLQVHPLRTWLPSTLQLAKHTVLGL